MNCEAGVCTLFIRHIVPALGGLCSFGVGLAPMKSIMKVNREKKLGSVDPLPFVFICANSLSWILYGYMLRDPYLFVANYFIVLLALYYCFSAYRYSPENTQNAVMIAMLSCIAILFGGSAIGFIIFNGNSTGKLIMGNVCLLSLISLYGSPLHNMANVIKSKNAISINPILSLASLCAAIFWSLYGFVQNNIFIQIPNLLGISLAVTQFVLIVVYGRRLDVCCQEKEPLDSANFISHCSMNNVFVQ